MSYSFARPSIKSPTMINISSLDKHDLIHAHDQVNSTIIKLLSIRHGIPLGKCRLESFYGVGILHFSDQEIIDFGEYTFVLNVEDINIDVSYDCRITDFSCFKQLQQFDLRCNSLYFITKLRLPDTLKMLYVNIRISIIGMVLPHGLQTLKFGFEYHNSLVGIVFPNDLKRIEIDRGSSLVGVIFPDSLQELILGLNHTYSFADVIFPERLRFIEFRSTANLKDIVLPKYIEKIKMTYCTLMSTSGMVLPETLTCLKLSSTMETHSLKCRVTIPSNFTDIEIDYETMSDKTLIFPDTLKKLTIIDLATSLNDLPRSIEELNIHSVSENVTNLPMGLKKITISDMTDTDIASKFERLPYGCTITTI
ncbi:MAG: hypothetical protein Gaeavirus14_14 [Gaeavirus sp.]|uniref:Uncharacterized protein n=1 Tax=Gaeavirus sp. TaxID=2487767 RepID=A0A3G5A106_9VIRU|nr:MAG: hypothetical protein Gaeavirus14_14 [Gaeavirus sp.]